MSDEAPQWAPLTTIRPDDDGKLLIKCAWNQKRLRVQQKAFFEYLKVQAGTADPSKATQHLDNAFREKCVIDPETNEEDLTHARHWWSRGWHPSLSHYMWSMRPEHYDHHSPDHDVDTRRREATTRYLEQSPPPERLVPAGEKYPLPEPSLVQCTVTEAILKRRSRRSFLELPCPLEDLSGLLKDGLPGLLERRRTEVSDPLDYIRRPAAGLDFYAVISNVDGLEPGVYFFSPEDHALVLLRKGDFREKLRDCAMGMPSPMTANFTLFMVADFPHYQWRYRDDCMLRKVYILVGSVAQHLLIAGEQRNIGGVVTPATKDSEIGSLLKLDPVRQAPVYSLFLGKYKEKK